MVRVYGKVWNHPNLLPKLRRPVMSDRHMRILAMAARHSQRQLDTHDAIDDTPDAASMRRRHDLKQRATRTRARVAAAQARRRHRSDD